MTQDFTRADIPRHVTGSYLEKALDTISMLNAVSAQDLARELNLGISHTLSVINALELEQKVRLRRGKWELK